MKTGLEIFLHHCVSLTLPGLHHPAYCKLYWLFNAEWIACVFQRTTKAAGEKCPSPPLPGHFQFSPHKTPRKGHIAYFECLVTQSKNSFFSWKFCSDSLTKRYSQTKNNVVITYLKWACRKFNFASYWSKYSLWVRIST